MMTSVTKDAVVLNTTGSTNLGTDITSYKPEVSSTDVRLPFSGSPAGQPKNSTSHGINVTSFPPIATSPEEGMSTERGLYGLSSAENATSFPVGTVTYTAEDHTITQQLVYYAIPAFAVVLMLAAAVFALMKYRVTRRRKARAAWEQHLLFGSGQKKDGTVSNFRGQATHVYNTLQWVGPDLKDARYSGTIPLNRLRKANPELVEHLVQFCATEASQIKVRELQNEGEAAAWVAETLRLDLTFSRPDQSCTLTCNINPQDKGIENHASPISESCAIELYSLLYVVNSLHLEQHSVDSLYELLPPNHDGQRLLVKQSKDNPKKITVLAPWSHRITNGIRTSLTTSLTYLLENLLESQPDVETVQVDVRWRCVPSLHLPQYLELSISIGGCGHCTLAVIKNTDYRKDTPPGFESLLRELNDIIQNGVIQVNKKEISIHFNKEGELEHLPPCEGPTRSATEERFPLVSVKTEPCQV